MFCYIHLNILNSSILLPPIFVLGPFLMPNIPTHKAKLAELLNDRIFLFNINEILVSHNTLVATLHFN